jgi:hypothetical protein
MTLLTLPAQPGQDTIPAVPWQRMFWVTWRQHRATLIGVTSVLAAASIFLLIAGLQVHHDYAGLANGTEKFGHFENNDWRLGNTCLIFMNLAPALIGAFTGPAVLARELENGTYRYAWTQGIGRVRWTIAKLVLLGAVVTIAALLITPLFTWLFAPFLTTQSLTAADPAVFATHGTHYAAWTLTAFCLGAFFGMLIRRIIPAMAATLAIYVALAAVTWFYLRNHYPVITFWPAQLLESAWLVVLSALLAWGTVTLVRRHPS